MKKLRFFSLTGDGLQSDFLLTIRSGVNNMAAVNVRVPGCACAVENLFTERSEASWQLYAAGLTLRHGECYYCRGECPRTLARRACTLSDPVMKWKEEERRLTFLGGVYPITRLKSISSLEGRWQRQLTDG